MKNWIIVIILIVIACLFIFIWINRTVTYENDEYGFSFKYSSNLIKRYNESTLLSLTNKSSSIDINIIATIRENETIRDISELGVGYVNLLKIYNENISYSIISDETISISDGKYSARKVNIKIENDGTVSYEIAILIPVDNREITIISRSTEKSLNENIGIINKMIGTFKIM